MKNLTLLLTLILFSFINLSAQKKGAEISSTPLKTVILNNAFQHKSNFDRTLGYSEIWNIPHGQFVRILDPREDIGSNDLREVEVTTSAGDCDLFIEGKNGNTYRPIRSSVHDNFTFEQSQYELLDLNSNEEAMSIKVTAFGHSTCKIEVYESPLYEACDAEFWYEYKGERVHSSDCKMTYDAGHDLTVVSSVRNSDDIREMSLTWRDQVFVDETFPFRFSNIESNMQVGTYPVSMTMTDNCGNSFTKSCTIIIEDDCIGEPETIFCTDELDPVCGCDGLTYRNECYAIAVGIKKTTPGSCFELICNADFWFEYQGAPTNQFDCKLIYDEGHDLSIIAGVQNASDIEVVQIIWRDQVFVDESFPFQWNNIESNLQVGTYPISMTMIDICGNTTTKTCTVIIEDECFGEPLNIFCTDELDPVCGCDGNTYRNSCYALAVGIKKTTPGNCFELVCDADFWFEYQGAPTNQFDCKLIYDEGHDLSIIAGVQNASDIEVVQIIWRDQVFVDESFPFQWNNIESNLQVGTYPISMTMVDKCGNTTTKTCTVIIEDECFGEPLNIFCTDEFDPVCGCDGNTYRNSCYALAVGIKKTIPGECSTTTCVTDFWFDNNGTRAPDTNCELVFLQGQPININVGVTNPSQIRDISLFINDLGFFDDSFPFSFSNVENNLPPGRYPVTLTCVDICGQTFTRTCTVVVVSNACSIDLIVSDIICHDNNTPFDPEDDTYTFSVTGIANQNGGTQWEGGFSNAFWGAFSIPPTDYGQKVNLGPFPAGTFTATNISPPVTITTGLSIDVSISKVGDFSCGATTTIHSPGTCSTTTCVTDFWFDNNGTRASDNNCELVFLQGQPININVGVTNPSQIRDISLFINDLGFFDDSFPFSFSNVENNLPPGRYPVTLTCVDICGQTFTRTCTVVVVSNACSIDLIVSDIICHDNNTPFDPEDDTYTFSVTGIANQNGGTQWEGGFSNAFWGAFSIPPTDYGQKVNLGPFPAGTFTATNISPPVTITTGLSIDVSISKVGDFSCGATTTIHSPGTCSTTTCVTDFWFDNNGTRAPDNNCELVFLQGQPININVGVTNPSQIRDISLFINDLGFFDDSFPFSFSNVENNLPPGRYPVTLTCVDICGQTFTKTCTIVVVSNTCLIDLIVSDVVCHDNHTPFDPTDDTYTFSVTGIASQNAGTQWEGGFSNAFWGAFSIPPTDYGQKVNLGPFPAGTFTATNISPPVTITTGLDIDVSISKVGDFSCRATTTISAPGTCSTAICETDFWFDYKGTRASDTNCQLIYPEGHDLIIKAGVENHSDIAEVQFVFRDIAIVDTEFPYEWHNAETNMSPGSYPVSITLVDKCGNSFTKTCVVIIEECELIFSEGHNLTIRAGVEQHEDIQSISLTFRDQVFVDDSFPFEWIDIEKNMSPGRYPLTMTLTDDCDNILTRRCTVVITERVCNADIWFDYKGDRAPTINCEMVYTEGHDLNIRTQVKNHEDIREVQFVFRDVAFFDDSLPFEWTDVERNMSPGRYPISMLLTDICGNSFTKICTIVIETKICHTDFWFDIIGSSSSNETIDEADDTPSVPTEKQEVEVDSQQSSESESSTKESSSETPQVNDKTNVVDSENWMSNVPTEKSGLMLIQNKPNPFQEETVVKFFTPIDSEVELVVFDLSGKLLMREKSFYKEGWHESPITSDKLAGSGVYIYELNNGTEVLRKKMMSM